MIRCEVIEEFTLKEFDKLENIKRVRINENGKLFVGDTFECDEEMADYLTGKNPLNKVVVNVIEVKEAKVVEENEQEETTEEKKTKKRATKKIKS